MFHWLLLVDRLLLIVLLYWLLLIDRLLNRLLLIDWLLYWLLLVDGLLSIESIILDELHWLWLSCNTTSAPCTNWHAMSAGSAMAAEVDACDG